jgi:phosphatidylglycerol:prolipoprotein diacylglycerol transferase
MPSVLAVIKLPWTFPVVLHFGAWAVPIHPVCDLLAYSLGFRLYLLLKKYSSQPPFTWEQNVWIFIACIYGALLGAKLLAWAEAPFLYWALRHDPHFWFGGKTIVGGLLGGWAGIEIAKKFLGITRSTGDFCVFPLILGMCIGRIGCFLTGLSDNTCGIRTTLPWAVDYGDGIPRHPAQIYEILFLLALGFVFWITRRAPAVPGLRFRWFMLAYLGFRFYIDFFKPHFTLFGGLSAIQWACLFALPFCAYSIMRLIEQPQIESQNV